MRRPGRSGGAPVAGQGLGRHGRVRLRRAEQGPRPVRLRRPARVRHLRDGDVRRAGRRPPLRGQRGAQPAVVDFCERRPAAAPRRLRPTRRPARAVGLLERGDRPRFRARSTCRRPLPGALARHTPTWTRSGTAAQRLGDAVRVAHRRRRTPAGPRLPQQRPPGHRPPRRWREHPLEGLSGDQQLAVGVPGRA